MTPSVRGRRKTLVATLLAGSAAGSGALVGFAVGVAWAVVGLPPLPGVAVLGVVAVAVALDVAERLARGRAGPGDGDGANRAARLLRPPAVGRQVPREWSRLFSPPTVAVLYGARLGVGPATILPTWLWWAALAVAASAGVWTSVAAGVVFGVVRTLLMVALAEWVRHRAAPRMARVRAAERAAFAVVAPLSLAAALLAG